MYRIRYNSIAKKYEFDRRLGNNYTTVLKGSLEKISEYAINFINEKELTFAYKTMNKNKHTIAEFGVLGKFLFSKSA